MILILSQEEQEQSTEDVMDWLWYFDARIMRLNGEEFTENILPKSLLIEENVTLSGIDFSDINVVWLRRWTRYNTLFQETIESVEFSNNQASNLKNYLWQENRVSRDAIFSSLKNKVWLPPREKSSLNKVQVLMEALKVGLRVPKSLITNSKSDLINFFYKCNEKIITKPLYESPYLFGKTKAYRVLTSIVEIHDIEKLEATFFTSYFQELIEKKFELRIFVLNDKLFSMAIFSQLDTQTSIDFRNYNNERPNRTVPYKLEKNTETKLLELFKSLNLNTGSVDILVEKETNDYVFLEINPVGQFGMTSKPCNYYLEKEIAQYLILKDKNNE